MADFNLDARLERDSVFIADGPLSQIRLMNDTRFPWLILIPRIVDAVEWIDLPGDAQRLLLAEIHQCGHALKQFESCEKINIGALGNIVRQLHVHIVARHSDDAAWPGPVWGSGTAMSYTPDELEQRIASLKQLFARTLG
jgi:diadenosine tetraphosphate (Ap4A) HIT family hydrolase